MEEESPGKVYNVDALEGLEKAMAQDERSRRITMQEGAVDAQVRSATAGFSIDSTSSFKQTYGRIHKRRGTRGRRFGTGLGRSHSQLVIAQDVSESFRRALRKGREERAAKKKQGVLSPTKIEEKKQIMSKLAGG